MSGSMAEVLAAHVAQPESLSHCSCGNYAEWTPMSHAVHQEAMLAADGYGKLENAWREGFTSCARQFMKQAMDPEHPITRTNPYGRRPE